jgi:hypothetical protein
MLIYYVLALTAGLTSPRQPMFFVFEDALSFGK